MSDMRLPYKMVGLCSACGRIVDLYRTAVVHGKQRYKVDAHVHGDNTHAICPGSNEFPAGEPMHRHVIESSENEPRPKKPGRSLRGFILGW